MVLTISWTSRFVFGINICVLVQTSDLREMRGNITETLGLNSALGTGILVAYGAMLGALDFFQSPTRHKS